MMRPVAGSMLPGDGWTALRLLMGLARLTWLNRLKNSARNSMACASLIWKRLMMEKSTLVCRGPRKELRATLPKSVPAAAAIAVPAQLGITWPAVTTARANANGLKK